MKTSVAIIGGGPAGLLLSQLLDLAGIDSVVLERQTKEYVLQRIRAGVLEWGTVEVLRQAGVGVRMDSEGHLHDGTGIAWAGERYLTIDTKKYTNKPMMAYGQTAITEDLYAVRKERDGIVIDAAENVVLHEVTSNKPYVTYSKNGENSRLDCDFIAGCDGFHGTSRQSIPSAALRTFEKVYPFAWLGIMSETPPLEDIIYANHSRGFALASQRNPKLSRYYIQCALHEKVDEWSDERFWGELKARFPTNIADKIMTGPSIEKSIAPLRSFVAEPMHYGNLFLAGDAAHIVPPTGAKGLNLAVSDVYYLARGFAAYYNEGDSDHLDAYSQTALRRVWGAVQLSWYLTSLLHRFPDQDDFDLRMQENALDYLANSESAMQSLCEQYVGLPLE